MTYSNYTKNSNNTQPPAVDSQPALDKDAADFAVGCWLTAYQLLEAGRLKGWEAWFTRKCWEGGIVSQSQARKLDAIEQRHNASNGGTEQC